MNTRSLAIIAFTAATATACSPQPPVNWTDTQGTDATGTDSNGADVPLADAPAGPDVFHSNCGSMPSSITGTTFAPNGIDPIPGVLVYVMPDDAMFAPAPAMVTCQTCANPPSALAQATSNADGSFTIMGGPIDAGGMFTVVFESGGFRHVQRHVAIGMCAHVGMTPAQTKFAGASAGDDTIPRIVVAGYKHTATGDVNDRFTTVLDAIGITGYETVDPDKGGSPGSGTATLSTDLLGLLNNMSLLSQYQMLVVPCGSLGNFHVAANITPAMASNLRAWLGMGGRLYASDLAYSLIDQAYPGAITFATGGASTGDPADVGVGVATRTMPFATIPGTVVDQPLLMWMHALSILPASVSTMPIYDLKDPWGAMDSVPDAELSGRMGPSGVILVNGSVMWHTGTTANHPLTAMVDYANPGGNSCGRVVFSSYHVQSASSRTSTALTPQERVLEYLFFRLSTCIQIPG